LLCRQLLKVAWIGPPYRPRPDQDQLSLTRPAQSPLPRDGAERQCAIAPPGVRCDSKRKLKAMEARMGRLRCLQAGRPSTTIGPPEPTSLAGRLPGRIRARTGGRCRRMVVSRSAPAVQAPPARSGLPQPSSPRVLAWSPLLRENGACRALPLQPPALVPLGARTGPDAIPARHPGKPEAEGAPVTPPLRPPLHGPRRGPGKAPRPGWLDAFAGAQLGGRCPRGRCPSP
jgi:hypothetical protein